MVVAGAGSETVTEETGTTAGSVATTDPAPVVATQSTTEETSTVDEVTDAGTEEADSNPAVVEVTSPAKTVETESTDTATVDSKVEVVDSKDDEVDDPDTAAVDETTSPKVEVVGSPIDTTEATGPGNTMPGSTTGVASPPEASGAVVSAA
jgi:hypothetical protein